MRLSGLPQTEALSELACDVRAGLCGAARKTLPSRWFYDALGSLLFEAITLLPEYGLTRADLRVLEAHAGGIGARAAAENLRVIELGAGGGRKARIILPELIGRARRIEYVPIDVSRAALEACERDLDALLAVRPIEAAYGEGIVRAMADRGSRERVLVLFLGSNIGNFEPECALALLRNLRQNLQPGDALLIGMDLLKPADRLLRAYDDALGVTAAFNRNILARLNREMDASFPLLDFEHEARFDAANRRVEMHLRAAREMQVAIGALDARIHFRRGETIWTESSYKFERGALPLIALASGFREEACWVDAEWPFAESLWIAS